MGCKCQSNILYEEEIQQEGQIKKSDLYQENNHIFFQDKYRDKSIVIISLAEFDQIEPDIKDFERTQHQNHKMDKKIIYKDELNHKQLGSLKPSLKSTKTEGTSPLKSNKSVRFNIIDQ